MLSVPWRTLKLGCPPGMREVRSKTDFTHFSAGAEPWTTALGTCLSIVRYFYVLSLQYLLLTQFCLNFFFLTFSANSYQHQKRRWIHFSEYPTACDMGIAWDLNHGLLQPEQVPSSCFAKDEMPQSNGCGFQFTISLSKGTKPSVKYLTEVQSIWHPKIWVR